MAPILHRKQQLRQILDYVKLLVCIKPFIILNQAYSTDYMKYWVCIKDVFSFVSIHPRFCFFEKTKELLNYNTVNLLSEIKHSEHVHGNRLSVV